MFEAVHTNGANGMLMWMSQSAWPSMVWQTYDYYYDTNAGYFGLKKANQPVNAIFNPATREIVLVNATPDDRKELTVLVNLHDITGKLLKTESFTQSIPADSRQIISTANMAGLSGTVFVKTYVRDSDGREIADNFTWINATDKYRNEALSQLPEAALTVIVTTAQTGANTGTVEVRNTGMSPAFMIRLKTIDPQTGEQILPTYYTDNYFTLMPGETKAVNIEWNVVGRDARQRPEFHVEAWNYPERK
jgi:hypothetical protein